MAMKLIVLTPEHDVADEAGLINDMFAAGLPALHIRKPQYTVADCRKYIAAINTRFHSRIVMHNCFELVHEFGLGGIHLNTVARNSAELGELLSSTPVVPLSTSFHSWQEIKECETQYRYVFISPVFDSISKAGYTAAIDPAGAMETKRYMALQGKQCPGIIGLGGVGPAQLTTLNNYGFDGGAMLGAVWLAQLPVAVVQEALITIAAAKH